MDGLGSLPRDLIPSGLASVGSGERAVAELLLEQRECESRAYCRTLVGVYALHRAMYADREAEFLAQPADFAAVVEARRSLAAAENDLQAQVSTLLRLGSTATATVIETAVGYVDRLPGVFALIGENVISPKAGEEALRCSRVLTGEQAHEFDAALCERLTRDYEVLSLPDLRDAAKLIVTNIDPEAAERRRKRAVEDRTVTFRPDEDGMMAAFALLPGGEGAELTGRLDFIAGTVCDQDPRTVGQRRADGLMQLSRGYSTLGCDCEVEGCRYREARYQGEPDADGVVTRFITLINVVLNERDLAPEQSGPATADMAVTDAADGDGGRATDGRGTSDDDRGAAETDVTDADAGAAVDADTGAAVDVDSARAGASECADADADADAAAAVAPAAAAASAGEGDGVGARPTEPARLGYLEGYGPISAEYARELAAREDAKIRPFGRRIPDGSARQVTETDSWTTVVGEPESSPLSESSSATAATTGFGDGEAASFSVIDGDAGPHAFESYAHGALDFAAACRGIVVHFTPHTGPDEGDFGAGGRNPDGPPDPPPETQPPGSQPPGAQPSGTRPPDDQPPAQTVPPEDSSSRDTPPPDTSSAGTPPSPGPTLILPEADGPHDSRREPAAVTVPTGMTVDRERLIVTAQGSNGYRPSTDLRRYLRMLMPRCVFPHCTRPSVRAQIDHSREYDHGAPELGGATTVEQIQPLCIRHHQLKTAGEWIDARLPDGRILWTSPDGRRYIVDPAGTTLQLFPDLARVRWTVPVSASPQANTARPGGPTRLQREHARRERLRRIAVATLEAEAADAKRPRSTVEQRLAKLLGAPPAPLPAAGAGLPPF